MINLTINDKQISVEENTTILEAAQKAGVNIPTLCFYKGLTPWGGCRFCMVACPYSSRSFNWSEPEVPEEIANQPYSPETSVPQRKGTVEKCDFCPDMLRRGKLPHCVTACPNGVFYFGDINEDTVTNGDETVRFSELIREKAGYRYLEELGTEPSVYYLPPVDRMFPFKEDDNQNKKE